jgi:hypothetical protein
LRYCGSAQASAIVSKSIASPFSGYLAAGPSFLVRRSLENEESGSQNTNEIRVLPIFFNFLSVVLWSQAVLYIL